MWAPTIQWYSRALSHEHAGRKFTLLFRDDRFREYVQMPLYIHHTHALAHSHLSKQPQFFPIGDSKRHTNNIVHASSFKLSSGEAQLSARKCEAPSSALQQHYVVYRRLLYASLGNLSQKNKTFYHKMAAAAAAAQAARRSRFSIDTCTRIPDSAPKRVGRVAPPPPGAHKRTHLNPFCSPSTGAA